MYEKQNQEKGEGTYSWISDRDRILKGIEFWVVFLVCRV